MTATMTISPSREGTTAHFMLELEQVFDQNAVEKLNGAAAGSYYGIRYACCPCGGGLMLTATESITVDRGFTDGELDAMPGDFTGMVLHLLLRHTLAELGPD